MNILTCTLILLGATRLPARIGQWESTFRMRYGQCVETVTKIGRTKIEDEVMWIRVVDDAECIDWMG